MTDQVTICNMALANLGSYVPIQSLDENSKEARACAMYFEHCLDMMLRDYAWSFSKREIKLADLGDPTHGWKYRYQYPTDALMIVRIGSFTLEQSYTDFHKLQYQFMVIGTDSGKAILSNIDDAGVVYVKQPSNPNAYGSIFVDALAWLISSRIAMGITGDANMAQIAGEQYRAMVQKAIARDLGESAEPPRQEAETIRVRDVNDWDLYC